MKILLTARNVMGLEASYEIDANSKEDIQLALRKLYGRTGIVRADVHPEYATVIESLPERG
jgi:hypothetical protein